MSTRITILFPRDSNRNYFSKEHQGYSNDLKVSVNGNLLISNIDDAEENLPLCFSSIVDNLKIIKFDYYITFGDGTEESATISFIFNDRCYVTVDRPRYLVGSDRLDQYQITFDVNGTIYHMGPEYHQSETKRLEMIGSRQMPFRSQWTTKKSFIGSDLIYWDDAILELECNTED